MGEMDQAALSVPDVLPVHDHLVAQCNRNPPADRDVVLDLDGQTLGAEPDDELLMRSRAAAPISEDPDDYAVRRDLELRSMIGEVGSNSGVIRGRRRAGAAPRRSAAADGDARQKDEQRSGRGASGRRAD